MARFRSSEGPGIDCTALRRSSTTVYQNLWDVFSLFGSFGVSMLAGQKFTRATGQPKACLFTSQHEPRGGALCVDSIVATVSRADIPPRNIGGRFKGRKQQTSIRPGPPSGYRQLTREILGADVRLRRGTQASRPTRAASINSSTTATAEVSAEKKSTTRWRGKSSRWAGFGLANCPTPSHPVQKEGFAVPAAHTRV